MNENISFTDYASGTQLPYCSKLSINWKNDNDLTISRNDIIVILWRSLVSLVKFSYWSKFPFNIITGSGFMTIFSFQFSSVSSKSGNRNNPVWVLPISGGLRELGIPDLARISLIKCYWMMQSARVTVFTVTELLREKQGVKLPTHPNQIKIKEKRDISVDM